jgi:glycosyltransferase involved in cell wall biosynthesis
MNPDVSVIVPTFNRRAMVLEAVESVLAQRGTRFELIVIDDGSTDGSSEELDRIAASTRVESWSYSAMRVARTENRGVAATRNLGVAMAAAALVAFLDSDDLWARNKLARQVEFMRANPHYALSQTGEIWIRNGVRVNPGMRHRKRAGDIFADSLRTCLISPSAAIMRTALFRELGGFDEHLLAAEDYDLWLRVLVDHEVGLLDEPLLIRRGGHRGQLSATVGAIDRFRIMSLLKLLAHSELPRERRAPVCDVLVEKCTIYAKGLARRGHFDAAGFIQTIAHSAASCREGGGRGPADALSTLATMPGWQPAPDAQMDAPG